MQFNRLISQLQPVHQIRTYWKVRQTNHLLAVHTNRWTRWNRTLGKGPPGDHGLASLCYTTGNTESIHGYYVAYYKNYEGELCKRYDLHMLTPINSLIANSEINATLPWPYYLCRIVPPLLHPSVQYVMPSILSIILLISSFAIAASAYALSDRPVLKYGTAWKKEVCTVTVQYVGRCDMIWNGVEDGKIIMYDIITLDINKIGFIVHLYIFAVWYITHMTI